MTLEDCTELATRLMTEHHLIEDGWRFVLFRIDNDAVVARCDYTNKCIKVDPVYVITNDADEVGESILHEIAHAFTGHEADHHGPEWEAKCVEIGGSSDLSGVLLL